MSMMVANVDAVKARLNTLDMLVCFHAWVQFLAMLEDALLRRLQAAAREHTKPRVTGSKLPQMDPATLERLRKMERCEPAALSLVEL
jgi:hypothetical protein